MQRSNDTSAQVQLFGLPGEAPHERVVFATDHKTGLRAIIAIYSTALGPAFGGCRYWSYAHQREALTDALRLSQGMAYKNALADLPFGGGKAVVLRDTSVVNRHELFAAFGRIVDSLRGMYITAEDVGTTAEDMRAVQQQTNFVSGIPRESGAHGGNPSPYTAYGVYVGLAAAAEASMGRRTLAGVKVAVQGLGSVGWQLCERLYADGAHLIVSDIDPGRLDGARQTFNAHVVKPEEITRVKADVFAPCALGGSITAPVAAECQFKVIAGGANNQLLSQEEGDELHKRGVFYVPDFLINAGGIISCVREYEGSGNEDKVLTEISKIRERVFALHDRVQAAATPPARVAIKWAEEKILRAKKQ